MGAEQGDPPFSTFGAITDVNIWNRLLTETELNQWSRCQLPVGGNILDWTTARWNIMEGVIEEEVDKEKICGKKESFLIIKKIRRNFDATDKYCRILGGEMLVARNNQTLTEMIEAFETFFPSSNFAKNGQQMFFMGYIKNDNNDFVDINTGEVMKELKIEYHYMSGAFRQGDCAVYHIQHGIFTLDCTHKFRPICKVTSLTSYHLQGVCKNSQIDRFFTLETPESLLGYSRTRMVWSDERSRWEIAILKHYKLCKNVAGRLST